jgi:hypothetical protein
MKDIRRELTICPNCQGHGWIEGHHYMCDGDCVDCPVQIQCEACEATGIRWKKDLVKIKEVIENDNSDLDDDLPF